MKIKLVVVLLSIIFSTVSGFSQSFQFTVTVGDGTNSQELVIGLDENGADIETDLDVIAPPPPPSDAFDARIKRSDQDYIKKLLKNDQTSASFKIWYVAASGAGPITITWDASGIPTTGTFTITDPFTGQLFSADMSSLEGSFTPSTSAGVAFLASELTIAFEANDEQTPVAAAPVFDPPPGTYRGSVVVSLSSETPESSIHYTTDGSVPTSASRRYTSPFELRAEAVITVRAITMAPDHKPSVESSATYDIELDLPDTPPPPDEAEELAEDKTIEVEVDPDQGLAARIKSDASAETEITFGASTESLSNMTDGDGNPVEPAKLEIAPANLDSADADLPSLLISASDTLNNRLGDAFRFRMYDRSGQPIDRPTFNPPAVMCFVPTAEQVAAAGDIANITLMTFDSRSERLELLPAQVSGDQVCVTLTHFSYFIPVPIEQEQATSTFIEKPRADQPEADLPPGTYYGSMSIEITSPTAGAMIYWTLDGTTPDSTSTLYTGAITVEQPGDYQLKAAATAEGYRLSPVFSAHYNLQPLTDESFRFDVDVTDGANTTTLTIGLDRNGSFEETFLDLFAPPSAPSGSFDARIKGSSSDYLRKILNDSLQMAPFELAYAPAADAGPVSILWKAEELPGNGVIRIKDAFTGEFFNEQMDDYPGVFTPQQSGAAEYLAAGLVLEFVAGALVPATPALLTPADELGDVGIQTPFTWSPADRADAYMLQLAEDAEFSTVTATVPAITETSYSVSQALEANTTYFWRVRATNTYAASPWSPTRSFTTGVRTSVDWKSEIPNHYQLEQNHPNPFNPSTVIRYALPQATQVRLEVFNVTGQRVAVLADGPMPAGWHEARFDASGLASGVYVYRLFTADGFSQSRRLLLVK